jgi:hypothetical protein
MRHQRITKAVGTLSLLVLLGALALADSGKRNLKADLEGFQEVPAISTAGEGKFRAKISKDESMIEFELSYSDLEGGAVLFAHIHLGQVGVNGGVAAFLCGGGDKPACPSSGTVTGTIVAADIIGPAGQGIAPGELSEVIHAMRAGKTYVNVHTTTFSGGEVRGQIK